ncbi:hypothetical protein ACTHUG_11380, partial [Neisseria sp. P0022.S009]|uniref:hypothetical protein n=1 Tax=Neisseria sp. P0022.S009 TaxID=3436834 RepID=UPI003F805120
MAVLRVYALFYKGQHYVVRDGGVVVVGGFVGCLVVGCCWFGGLCWVVGVGGGVGVGCGGWVFVFVVFWGCFCLCSRLFGVVGVVWGWVFGLGGGVCFVVFGWVGGDWWFFVVGGCVCRCRGGFCFAGAGWAAQQEYARWGVVGFWVGFGGFWALCGRVGGFVLFGCVLFVV